MKVNIEPDSALPKSAVPINSTSLIEEKTRKIHIIDDQETEYLVGNSEQEVDKKVDPMTDSEERKKKLDMLESAWNELQNANPYRNKADESENTKNESAVNVDITPVEKPHTYAIPTAAKTCSQFELHWRTLKSSEENLYLYLKVCILDSYWFSDYN